MFDFSGNSVRDFRIFGINNVKISPVPSSSSRMECRLRCSVARDSTSSNNFLFGKEYRSEEWIFYDVIKFCSTWNIERLTVAMRIAASAGVTPGNRDAWPTVAGRTLESTSRDSMLNE